MFGSKRRRTPLRRPNASARKVSFGEGFVALTRHRDFLMRLIGASLAWFLMDFAYYGNTVRSPLVLPRSARTRACCTTR